MKSNSTVHSLSLYRFTSSGSSSSTDSLSARGLLSRAHARHEGLRPSSSLRRFTLAVKLECRILQICLKGLEISTRIGSSKQTGSISDTDHIEKVHPGYLHYLFRLVLKRIGYNYSFREIAYQMNQNSRIPSEKRMNINLSRRQVNKWFRDIAGKQSSPIE